LSSLFLKVLSVFDVTIFSGRLFVENTTKTPAQYLSYGKIWHQDLALEEIH
jgi:hypothetical protein